MVAMASISWVFSVIFIVIFITSNGANSVADSGNGASDLRQCINVCGNTYSLQNYEQGNYLDYCRHGCRLLGILDLVTEFENLNNTKDLCQKTCCDAYRDEASVAACSLGCDSQVTASEHRRKLMKIYSDTEMASLSPLMYVHGVYSNMADKLSRHVQYSWSYFIQSDTGSLVVVRSEPARLPDDDDLLEYKTSNYMETNLAELDSSATVDLYGSQMESNSNGDSAAGFQHLETTSWRTCITVKAGASRMLVFITIVLSVLVVVWIWAGIPRANNSRKLSIYGDLEYLEPIDEKSLIKVLSEYSAVCGPTSDHSAGNAAVHRPLSDHAAVHGPLCDHAPVHGPPPPYPTSIKVETI